jgi:hypothetical protein
VHRTPATFLSAVTLVAAFGLSGCGDDGRSAQPASPAPRTTAAEAAPPVAPLPAPEALADVLYQLADPSIPVQRKIGLLQYGTVADEPALQNFGEALAANGFAPLTVTVTDLAWAGQPGDVVANVTIGSTAPAARPFTYPLQFSPLRDTWQLTRRTADQLLPLVSATPPTPTG